jgi:hypothetical protein
MQTPADAGCIRVTAGDSWGRAEVATQLACRVGGDCLKRAGAYVLARIAGGHAN